MNRVAIIAALPGEQQPLGRGWAPERRGAVRLWRRRRGDCEWIAACAGVGGAAAARALTEAGRDGDLQLILSVGWAGALRADLRAGQAHEVAGVVDAQSGERFLTAAVSRGWWVTTSPAIADHAMKRRLAAVTGAALVDMEAAALARWAAARRIPFRCIKAVSDGLDEALPDFNCFIGRDGQFQLARFVVFAAVRPSLWPGLVRIGRLSRQAARALREAVLAALEDAPQS